MVWGGRRLATLLRKTLPPEGTFGEAWEVSDHPLHRSRIATGPRRGETLRGLMESDRVALVGGKAAVYEQFPWLVKFLDINDWLSVQVHPDVRAVQRLRPGEGSKTEAWFVLGADPESRVYAGLRPGIDEARLRAALKDGTVADCLHSFVPHAGDCVFLPAGTVHAAGGGVLIAEVQQTSDVTFRLFDWNRVDAQGQARTLHIEEALASTHWNQGPVDPIRVPAFAEPEATAAALRQPLVRCPYFVLEYVQSREPLRFGGDGRLQVLIAVRGTGRWQSPLGEEPLRLGQAWLLPASLPRLVCQPEPFLGALLCTLP
jgi:mannose-6-phosphate isomerase